MQRVKKTTAGHCHSKRAATPCFGAFCARDRATGRYQFRSRRAGKDSRKSPALKAHLSPKLNCKLPCDVGGGVVVVVVSAVIITINIFNDHPIAVIVIVTFVVVIIIFILIIITINFFPFIIMTFNFIVLCVCICIAMIMMFTIIISHEQPSASALLPLLLRPPGV